MIWHHAKRAIWLRPPHSVNTIPVYPVSTFCIRQLSLFVSTYTTKGKDSHPWQNDITVVQTGVLPTRKRAWVYVFRRHIWGWSETRYLTHCMWRKTVYPEQWFHCGLPHTLPSVQRRLTVWTGGYPVVEWAGTWSKGLNMEEWNWIPWQCSSVRHTLQIKVILMERGGGKPLLWIFWHSITIWHIVRNSLAKCAAGG